MMIFISTCYCFIPSRPILSRKYPSITKLNSLPSPSSEMGNNQSAVSVNYSNDNIQGKRKKMIKRWATGLSLGAIGTLWIFSGNGLFTLGFLVASLIAQNEYYAMVTAAGKKTGLAPASKTGIVSSLACYIIGKTAVSLLIHTIFLN